MCLCQPLSLLVSFHNLILCLTFSISLNFVGLHKFFFSGALLDVSTHNALLFFFFSLSAAKYARDFVFSVVVGKDMIPR